jgi:hypothetical protein
MFGREKRKSRLERENDALEERIRSLEWELDFAHQCSQELELKYLRNLREYRFSQKANERHKRANRRLRKMLDVVGWPKNDMSPTKPERLVPRKVNR